MRTVPGASLGGALVTLVAAVSPATPVAAAPPQTPTLVDIRASHHPGFDRLVLEFDGGLPASHRVEYVDRLVADGSGLPVRVAGRAVLRVVLSPARAHDDRGRQTVPRRRAFALPNVMTTVRAGDFEAVTTYGVGLARRTPFEVSTRQDPSRLVIDVRAGFRTVQKPVYFLDRDRFVDNLEPFFVSRKRPVLPGTPATGLMDRLFAGPLPAERRQGLRLVRSRATGFADLAVSDEVARVRLTGGCSSGGSTVTIAGSIMPTLRRLPTVDWVKVLDPAGRTGSPTGQTDSIPACLEP
jgi:Sporulation and spore germination